MGDLTEDERLAAIESDIEAVSNEFEGSRIDHVLSARIRTRMLPVLLRWGPTINTIATVEWKRRIRDVLDQNWETSGQDLIELGLQLCAQIRDIMEARGHRRIEDMRDEQWGTSVITTIASDRDYTFDFRNTTNTSGATLTASMLEDGIQAVGDYGNGSNTRYTWGVDTARGQDQVARWRVEDDSVIYPVRVDESPKHDIGDAGAMDVWEG